MNGGSSVRAVFAALLISGLAAGCSRPAPPPSHTLLIAPHIQGIAFCPQAGDNPAVGDADQAAIYCAKVGSNAAATVNATLDALGPVFSPSHRYALGYILPLPLMRYFVKRDGTWQIDQKLLQNDLSLLRDVDRPAVLYFSANHFTDSGTALAKSLAADPRNLMWTSKGPLNDANYFAISITAWTIADDQAPVNVMRRQAFAAALEAVCKMDPAVRSRIAAVSLLGEVHQLYPDFTNGMGYGDSYSVTDYSPVSVKGFRDWLKTRYGDVGAFNSAVGGHFHTFDEIAPPSRNVLNGGGDPLQHLDASAAGTLAIYGWTHEPHHSPLKIDLYIDGVKVASAPSDLNRTDVPDADKSVDTPNVGYHFDYDYRALKPGVHELELTATSADGKLARFGWRPFTVASPTGGAVPALPAKRPVPPGVQTTEGLSLNIDGPKDGVKILANPLAGLWLDYRNFQVRRYYEQFAALTRGSCIPRDKIFDHEVSPQLNATWDAQLMAVSAAQSPDPLYSQGATLYGGAAFGDAFFRFKQAQGWSTYSAPELHPTFALSRGNMEAMFERHRQANARFVSPYYLYAMPARFVALDTKLHNFRITPDNTKFGSSTYYEAIRDLMRHH